MAIAKSSCIFYTMTHVLNFALWKSATNFAIDDSLKAELEAMDSEDSEYEEHEEGKPVICLSVECAKVQNAEKREEAMEERERIKCGMEEIGEDSEEKAESEETNEREKVKNKLGKFFDVFNPEMWESSEEGTTMTKIKDGYATISMGERWSKGVHSFSVRLLSINNKEGNWTHQFSH